jgi:hypothetical protein
LLISAIFDNIIGKELIQTITDHIEIGWEGVGWMYLAQDEDQ